MYSNSQLQAARGWELIDSTIAVDTLIMKKARPLESRVLTKSLIHDFINILR